MAGFFATVKAINKSSSDLLLAGKDFATKFKNGDLSPEDYEAGLIGKIHEIVNKNSNGDSELEKYLDKTFASAAIESLKEGIKSYKDSMEQPSILQDTDVVENSDSVININKDNTDTEKKAKTIKDLLSNN